MIESLLMPNVGGLAECFLCESITPNGKFDEWTIKVRPGIKFHNGEALDSVAVKANFDDLRKTGAVTASLLRPIASVDVVDPVTVKLILKEKFVNFPAILLTQRSSMVAPAQLKDPQGRNRPIGTGPYVFKEWKLNDSLTVTKNPNYWRKDYPPSFDEIAFKVIGEETARLTALKAGDIQGMMTANPLKIAELRNLSKDGKVSLVEFTKNAGVNVIHFNLAKWPTSDLRVRQALALSLDRQKLNEINNAGVLSIVDVPFLPSDSSLLNGLYPKVDLEKAKALIAQVEMETGNKVEFTVNLTAIPEQLEAAQTNQQFWERAGMKVKIVGIEQSAFVRREQLGDFQVTITRIPSALDPEELRGIFHSENYAPLGVSSGAYNRWKNGIVDSAFEHLRVNSDPVVRRRAADIVATELVNDWPIMITAATLFAAAVGPGLKITPPRLPSGRELQSSPTGTIWVSSLSLR